MSEKIKKCEYCIGVAYYDYIENYPEAKYCLYCGRYIHYAFNKSEVMLLHKEIKEKGSLL